MEFCSTCQIPAKSLIQEHVAEKERKNKTLKSVNAELHELKKALEVGNEKYTQEHILCEKLTTENQVLQELLVEANYKSLSALKTTNDALDLAKEQVHELRHENKTLKKCGQFVKKTAVISGVTALSGSALCAKIYKDAAGVLAGVGLGTLLFSGILHRLSRGRKLKKNDDVDKTVSSRDDVPRLN